MFEFFRSHQKLMQVLLLLLILPSFVLFGLEGYSRFRDGDDVIATVGDRSIKQAEFDAAKRQQLERMQQVMGSSFDPTILDNPRANKTLLDNLITERAVEWAVDKLHLTATDDNLRELIMSIPAVQVDGKFSQERYVSLLSAQGMTPESFEARLRSDLARAQVSNPLGNSEFLPKVVQAQLVKLNESERTVGLMRLKLEDYFSKVSLTDAQFEKYYQTHQDAFKTVEHADIEYVVLSPDAMAAKQTVADAEAKSYYEQNLATFRQPEQRRVRHILLTADKNTKPADLAKVKARAEALLAKVKASPNDFAAIAKAESQDPGSAANGGDLGSFARGTMVKPFEDAAFALQKDEISALVQSDFGFHVLQLLDIQPEKTQPLEAVRSQVDAEIRKQKAQKAFTAAAENFNDLVYDQPDSLQPVKDKYGLTSITAQGVQRQALPGAAADSPLANAAFLNALFADDVLKKRHNTKAMTVGQMLVAGRVTAYHPAAIKPLVEARSAIKDILIRESAQVLVKKQAETLLEKARAGLDVGFTEQKTVSRLKPESMSSVELAAIFGADAKKLPAYRSVDQGLAGITLIKVQSERIPAGEPAADIKALREAAVQRWQQFMAQETAQAALEVLKKRAKVEIKKPVAVTEKS
ncbi:MAG: SurA N-terminal domain-containing protein [Burkholderiaceae bacterium]|jgi:peptidyl-prolyl cis-trans isomerase D